MRIKNLDVSFEVDAATLVAQQGNTILANSKVIVQIESYLSREVDTVYLMGDSDECPVLLVEWRYYTDESNRYGLLCLDFSEQELQMLYDMGIL